MSTDAATSAAVIPRCSRHTRSGTPRLDDRYDFNVEKWGTREFWSAYGVQRGIDGITTRAPWVVAFS